MSFSATIVSQIASLNHLQVLELKLKLVKEIESAFKNTERFQSGICVKFQFSVLMVLVYFSTKWSYKVLGVFNAISGYVTNSTENELYKIDW